MRRIHPGAPTLTLLLVAAAACYDAPTEPEPGEQRRAIDLTQEWERATAAETGFDAARLDAAIASAEGRSSLVIVRDGYLVHESYGPGVDRNTLHDVRSVTKSVLSALVGVAIRDGLIPGTTRQIGDLLPASLGLDSQKRSIQVLHLLTMTSGFEWVENGPVGYNEWIVADDQVGYLLSRNLAEPPGSVFNYNSAASHLLSVILARVAGDPLPEWSQTVFFDQIGIDSVAWEPVSGGQVNGASGLDMRARDLARLGQLFLQQGASGVRQIVPRDWVLASVAPRFSGFGAMQGIGAPNYGFLWWLDLDDAPSFFAWGYGGQFVYVVPSLYLVIVLTSDWRDISGNADQANAQSVAALETIGAIIEAAR